MKLQQENPQMDINDPKTERIIAQEANEVLSRTKHIAEDSEEKGTARYIQPAGANITNIIDHDDRLVSLLMKLYGFLVGVDTTQRSSAESKSVDNISLAAQLTSIASQLQELELKVWDFMHKFDNSIKVPVVVYNTNYDIHELKSVISAIVELANLNAGDEYQKQIKLTAVHVIDLIKRISDDDYERIKKEIDSGEESKTPLTFTEQATHQTEASGDTPDNLKATTDYQKSTLTKVSKTENL